MKPRFVLHAVAAATALLLTAPLVRAEPITGADQAHLARMVRGPHGARIALHEMMKDSRTKRMMAQELARDQEFRRFYVAEVGSDAPHQERNPSDHPELFRPRDRAAAGGH